MTKYAPNSKDVFIDYLATLRGLETKEFSKFSQLPIMKKPEKPRVQQNPNIRGNQPLQKMNRPQQPEQYNPHQQPQLGRPKPPRPIFDGNRGREAPVQDNSNYPSQTHHNTPPPPRPSQRVPHGN